MNPYQKILESRKGELSLQQLIIIIVTIIGIILFMVAVANIIGSLG